MLYVGQNQNDFTAPKTFSAPFLISQTSGTTTTTTAASASRRPARGLEQHLRRVEHDRGTRDIGRHGNNGTGSTSGIERDLSG